MHVAEWLRTLGLERYEPAFRENNVTADLLPSLTAEDLKELGVALVGDRRRLLTAIAALQSTPDVAAAVPEAGPVAKPEAERRQVTVMFCDLVGSTELSSRFDPEDLRELIGRYHARAAETVARFDGFVAKYMGDGVLAYFGYPHAHEDDAEQAVRAGLALIGAVGELQGPQRLQLRIGIATGLVVVGDLIGAGSAQEQAIVGETPNLAARMQALAEPGAVVISESTRRQIGGLFEVYDLGPQSLKGFAEPQRAWRVVSENLALGRFEALRSGATPLIGRDEEIDLLLRRWSQAKSGRGRVVLISGEPGVGKSRLAEVLAERVAGELHIRLRYFCSPHHQDSALYPIIAQMERAAGFSHEDSAAAKLTKLQAVLGTTGPQVEDVALIAELLALPATDFAPPLDVSPQRKKEKTFEALLRQVEGLSRQQPALMVFEDIHWIDPSSRELLDRAIERMVNWPVLLVATFRPEFQAPWVGQPHVAMLALTRLDRRDTAMMVANIAGNEGLPADIVQEIAERADGVPLFVEELTNAVLESGAQAALSSVPYPALSVPPTLHASLMARLDRLGPAAKAVAQTGAAIGREFGHELLAAVTDLPEPQLREALERLTQAGLLFVRGMPPHAYIFKHALVQDAAYGTLLRSGRRELHRRIAEALSRDPEHAESAPEILAYHFTRSAQTETAVGWWSRAGQRALSRSAYIEAGAHYENALSLAKELPDTSANRVIRLRLELGYGQALRWARGHLAPECAAAYLRARDLVETLEDVTERVRVWINIFTNAFGRADLAAMRDMLRRCTRDTEDLPGSYERRGALRMSGHTRFLEGDFAAAKHNLDQVAVAYAKGQISPGLEDIPAVTIGFLPLVLWPLGEIKRANQLSEEAVAQAKESGIIASTVLVTLYKIVFDLMCGNMRDAARHIASNIDLSRRHRLPLLMKIMAFFDGWAHWQERDRDSGMTAMRHALAEWRQEGFNLFMPLTEALMAHVEAAAGRLCQATGRLEGMIEEVDTTGQHWFDAELHRLHGKLLLRKNPVDVAGAEAAFQEALAVAHAQGTKSFELRTTLNLAGLYTAEGRDSCIQKSVETMLTQIEAMPELRELSESHQLRRLLANPRNARGKSAAMEQGLFP